MHLLAQLKLDSIPSFVMFIVGGSATIFLINQVLTFYKEHMKEQPTPSNTYATKVELSKVETELKSSLGEIETELTGRLIELGKDLKIEASAQAGKRKQMYQEIEQVGRDMATVKADQINQTRQLFSMETKIDRLIERTPRS